MSNIAIKVENLGKMYRIGEKQERYYTFRDTLTNIALAPFRRLRRIGKPPKPEEIIWALKDVSFEVKHGEVVGIIGRNGAGKTTLLKILTRITDPTEGHAEIHGRVASLLEVGTGFHPELTGRENIYLNGAILGMKKAEIERKFDEIVDFAEIEKFMDTPVKRYSSGMYVRLAFAVAAHLEPEILLVDEVLSVGDAAFQKKCLGKMGNVAKEGRTVLFVSHNMSAVQSLCDFGCLLESGRLNYLGPVQDTINTYLQSQTSFSKVALRERQDRSGTGRVRITSLSLDTTKNGSNGVIKSGDSLKVRISYESAQPLVNVRFLVGIYDYMNVPLFRLDSEATSDLPDVLPGNGAVICDTDPLNVTPGPCYMNVAVLVGGEKADHVVQAVDFNVEPSDFYSTGRLFDRRDSLFLLRQRWDVDEAEA